MLKSVFWKLMHKGVILECQMECTLILTRLSPSAISILLQLLTFLILSAIKKQVRIVSDRLFGNIHDTQPVTSAKGFSRRQIKETKSHKGSSFATNVIEIEEKAKSAWTEKKESSFPISTYQGCLFCNKSGHSF